MIKKSIIFSTLILLGTTTWARPLNPTNPDFNHEACSLKYLKAETLKAVVQLRSAQLEPERDPLANQSSAHKAYYLKLLKSVRSNGSDLYSSQLDQDLNFSGSCENAADLLNDILRTLK